MNWLEILHQGLRKQGMTGFRGPSSIVGRGSGPADVVQEAMRERAAAEAQAAQWKAEALKAQQVAQGAEKRRVKAEKNMHVMSDHLGTARQAAREGLRKEPAGAAVKGERLGRHAEQQAQKVLRVAEKVPFWQGFKAHMPKFMAGGAVLGGIAGGVHLARRLREKAQARNNFQGMMDMTPALRHEPERTVKDRFRTLQTIAPTIAKDPLVAGSIVRQWVEYPTVSATAIKDVVSVEKDLRGDTGLLKSYGSAAAGLLMHGA